MSPISLYIITTIIITIIITIISITITILTGVEVLDRAAVIEHRSASSLVGGGEVSVLDLRKDADLGGLFIHIVGDGGDTRVHCYLPVSPEDRREGRVGVSEWERRIMIMMV
jgi:hypothetical protein